MPKENPELEQSNHQLPQEITHTHKKEIFNDFSIGKLLYNSENRLELIFKKDPYFNPLILKDKIKDKYYLSYIYELIASKKIKDINKFIKECEEQKINIKQGLVDFILEGGSIDDYKKIINLCGNDYHITEIIQTNKVSPGIIDYIINQGLSRKIDIVGFCNLIYVLCKNSCNINYDNISSFLGGNGIDKDTANLVKNIKNYNKEITDFKNLPDTISYLASQVKINSDKNINKISIEKKSEFRKYIEKKMKEDYLLSSEEYNKLFIQTNNLKKTDISQGKIGNCKALSYIDGYRIRNFREPIIRKSIKVVNGGYEVYIPLGNKNGEVFMVYEKDLSNFSIDEEGNQQYWSNTLYRDTPKNKDRFKKGITVIEIAFAKYASKKSGNNNILTAKQIDGLNATVMPEELFDKNLVKSTKSLSCKSIDEIPILIENLYLIKQGNIIISTGTSFYHKNIKLTYDKDITEIPGPHAYNIKDIKVINGEHIIMINNPRDTSSPINMTISEFISYFNNINIKEIDISKIFDS